MTPFEHSVFVYSPRGEFTPFYKYLRHIWREKKKHSQVCRSVQGVETGRGRGGALSSYKILINFVMAHEKSLRKYVGGITLAKVQFK